MAEWKEYRVGEIFNIQNGYAFKSGEFVENSDDTYEVLKIGHIEIGGGLRTAPKKTYVKRNSKYKKWVLEKNDIVMGMTDMKSNVVILGIPALVDKNDTYVLNQRVARLSLKDPHSFDIYFCYYQMLWNEFTTELRKTANSGVQVNLTTSGISTTILYVPNYELQRKIGRLLSSLDDKIENNRKINANLEAQAQALFKSWFVDFEPFKDGEFQDSELGMIPKGWRVESLSLIADYINGLAMQKFRPQDGEEGLPVLKIKELGQGSFDDNSELCSPALIGDKYIINDGDIIFSWSGTLMVKVWCGGKCGLNQHLFVVVPKDNPKWFVYQWTKYHLDNFIRIAKDKAVTMGHIKRGELDKAKTLIPDKDNMQRIDAMMKPLFEQVIANELESRRLASLRDALLPRLMSGELKVNDVNLASL